MSDKSVSEEDKLLFRKAVESLKPNALTVKKSPHSNPTSPSIYLSDYYSDEVDTETVLSYSQSGIPFKRLYDLKKGKIPWQGRLDLHHLTSETAKTALLHFIEQQVKVAHRCLLIIHGKGGHQGEKPILKNLVNCWLRQLPEVLAFHSSLPQDGGNGAVYVLLKRLR